MKYNITNKIDDKWDIGVSRTSNWSNPWHVTGEEKSRNHFFENDEYQEEDFKVESEEIAAKNFKDWLIGEKFSDVLERKRVWILNSLKFLPGKKIFCEKTEYAEVLLDLAERKDLEIPSIKKIFNDKPIVKKNSIF